MDLKIVCSDPKYMPEYANDSDACMDLKVRIDGDNACKDCNYSSIVLPGETKVFGTGIQVSMPEDHVMLVFPRSSTGIKLHCMLANTTAVIDTGYRDEIKMAVTNFGKDFVILDDGQRLAQFMVIPRPKINLIPVQDDEDFRSNDRGGGIGSTGR